MIEIPVRGRFGGTCNELVVWVRFKQPQPFPATHNQWNCTLCSKSGGVGTSINMQTERVFLQPFMVNYGRLMHVHPVSQWLKFTKKECVTVCLFLSSCRHTALGMNSQFYVSGPRFQILSTNVALSIIILSCLIKAFSNIYTTDTCVRFDMKQSLSNWRKPAMNRRI